MKIVFRVSTYISYMSAGPRDFSPIAGLEHLGVVFQGRTFDSPEAINDAHALINDSRYPHGGCKFYAYALTAEDVAKLTPAPVEQTSPPAPVARPDHPTIVADLPVPTFTLDDKAILLDGVRVAGLFGEDKQLRVLAAHADLRPAIEAWLQSQLQPA